jgi:large subunit ribosomal protein L1
VFPQVLKVARILGPKGLMPSPAKGTVSPSIETLLKTALSATKVSTTDHSVSCAVGRTEWSEDDLVGNIKALVQGVKEMKVAKGDAKFVESVALTTPYGVGVILPERPFK